VPKVCLRNKLKNARACDNKYIKTISIIRESIRVNKFTYKRVIYIS
jgi:hypothetical protein